MKRELTPEQLRALQEKLKNMSPEELQKVVQAQCIFCQIAQGKVPAFKVYEDAKYLAFLEINPATPGHTIVIPKTHYPILQQMPPQEIAEYFLLITKLASIIYDATGAIATQIMQLSLRVPHVSMHIIPRFEEDGQNSLLLPYKPKKFSEDQFKKIQELILTKIKASVQEATRSSQSQKDEPKPQKPKKKGMKKVKLKPKIP